MKLSVVARRLTVAAAAFAAISFGTGQAVATTFTFAFHGSTVSGFGTLYATDNGDGSFTATSGFGHETFGITTEDFTLFNPVVPGFQVSPTGRFLFDNLLYPARDPMLAIGGLLFLTTGSHHEVNIWGTTGGSPGIPSTPSGGYTYAQWQPAIGNYSPYEAVSFQLTTVPEPASLTLFGLGLVGLAAIRRKSRKSAAA